MPDIKDCYSKDMKKFNAFTEQEEFELFEKTKAGCHESKDKIILSYLRLVCSISLRYLGRGLPYLDLVQEGNLGLIESIDKFEHKKGHKFTTYSVWIIKRYLISAIADNRSSVSMCEYKKRQITEMNTAFVKLRDELHREPTREELATKLNISANKVYRLETINREAIWLDKELKQNNFDKEDGATLKDILIDGSQDIYERVEREDIYKCVNEVVELLSMMEKKIIKRYYGFDMEDGETLSIIAKRFGTTRERIGRIKTMTEEKLSHNKVMRELSNLCYN